MQRTLELTFEEQTLTELEVLARAQGSTIQLMAQEVVRQYARDRTKPNTGQKLEQEIAAYQSMHAGLLQKYPGKYVAVHKGQVVDFDLDQLALYFRVRKLFPGEEILIRQVRPEIERILQFRSTERPDVVERQVVLLVPLSGVQTCAATDAGI